MTLMFEVKKLLHGFESETVCKTFYLEEAINKCENINGDFNFIVWVDGVFYDLYMDPDENEVRKIVKDIVTEYQINSF